MALKASGDFYGTCRGAGQGTESWRRARRLMHIQINKKIKKPSQWSRSHRLLIEA